jgi:hypothetical protein
MNEESNNITQPQDAATLPEAPDLLRQDGWFGTDLSGYWLQDDDKYEQPVWTLSWCGIPFAPLGNIHALTGQSGHGKTMTFSQIIVAILGGAFGNLKCILPDDVKRTALYIDTEMSKNDTLRVRERIFRLLGWRWGDHHPELKILRLRDVQMPEVVKQPTPNGQGQQRQEKAAKTGLPLQEAKIAVMRWKMVLQAIWEIRPTVAVIDGMLDVIRDYNDIEECQEIITKCMQVSSYYNCSVWCLVHQNPGRADKMAGSLGSILERKVTDILSTVKDKNKETGAVTFTVTQLKARGADVPDWQYYVEDDRDHIGMPKLMTNDTQAMPDDKRDAYKQELDKIFKEAGVANMGGTRYTDIINGLKNLGYTNHGKQEKIIKDGISEGIIYRHDNGRYYYSGVKPKQEEEMPFEATNEEAPY